MEMVQMGYERYAREHTVTVGWTKDYLEKHSDKVEKFLKVRWQNIPPLECFLRHVIARHECDTRAQLKDIRVPTVVLVGSEDHICASNLSHRSSSEEGNFQCETCAPTGRVPSLFLYRAGGGP